MIITKDIVLVNRVARAAVSIELTPYESRFVAAYGEPQIDLRGAFNYVPSAQQPATAPGLIALSSVVDLGTVPVAGTSTANAGLGAGTLEVSGSGTFTTNVEDNPGCFVNAPTVNGDWEFVARLDTAVGVVNPAAANGFVIGLALFTSPGEDAAGITLGWGGHNGPYEISLRQRIHNHGSLARVAGVTRTNPNGITLKLKRVSTQIFAFYSLNNGATFTALGDALIMTAASLRVGLFVSSGLSTAASTIFSKISLTEASAPAAGTFIVTGGPELVMLRSNAPHRFEISTALDSDALAKVRGWADGIANRCEAAKTALLGNAEPSIPSNQSQV
jgi:hypothetical protein